jgi:hypothetical protein
VRRAFFLAGISISGKKTKGRRSGQPFVLCGQGSQTGITPHHSGDAGWLHEPETPELPQRWPECPEPPRTAPEARREVSPPAQPGGGAVGTGLGEEIERRRRGTNKAHGHPCRMAAAPPGLRMFLTLTQGWRPGLTSRRASGAAFPGQWRYGSPESLASCTTPKFGVSGEGTTSVGPKAIINTGLILLP